MPSRVARFTVSSRVSHRLPGCLPHARRARTLAACAAAFALAASASAYDLYRQVNRVIPATNSGLTLNVETGEASENPNAVAGWDIRFAGTGGGSIVCLANTGSTAGFVMGSGSPAPVASVQLGSPVYPFMTFGQGPGSAKSGGWRLNGVNLVGFRFIAADGLTHYGWARILVGADFTERVLLDTVWQTSAGSSVSAGLGGPPPSYDRCSASNPRAMIGTNSLPMNQSATPNFDCPCGTIWRANYFKFRSPYDADIPDGTPYELPLTVSTCGSGAATRIAVLDGCGAGAKVIACSDDGACGASAEVSFTALGETDYFIVIGADSGASWLPSQLGCTVMPPTVPACADAAEVGFGTTFVDTEGGVGTLYAGTPATGNVLRILNPTYHEFTPAVTGAYTFSLCGSSGDSILALGFGGAACPGLGMTMDALAFNDNWCQNAPDSVGGQSWVASALHPSNSGKPLTQDLVAGTRYLLVVGESQFSQERVRGMLAIDGPPQPPANPADLNHDGLVSGADLAILLGQWGTFGPADLDHDGTVGAPDLAMLLGAWG